MGQHSKPGWFARMRRKLTNPPASEKSDPPAPKKAEKFRLGQLPKMVDTDTLEIHLLRPDFRLSPDGFYFGLCGKRFLPAGMTEPGIRRCFFCFEYVIPEERGWRFL
jgi:hypothetical protein